MADDASAAGLDVAPMPEEAQQELKAMLPYASPRNPVDATAQALTDLPLMTRYIAAMLEKARYAMFRGHLRQRAGQPHVCRVVARGAGEGGPNRRRTRSWR